MVTEPAEGTARRRRGKLLRDAVFAAVVEELIDHGYSGMTVERVATRAQTGKTTVYRHWPTKQDLVLDTVRDIVRPIDDPPFSGSVREDFLIMLCSITSEMEADTWTALRSLLGEAHRHPEIVRVVFEELIEPRQRIMLESLRQAAARGEISASAVSLLPVQVAIGVVNLHLLQYGAVPNDRELIDLVDRAVLPILGVFRDRAW